MSHTDKDTPYWVIEKTHPSRRAHHNHTRANNHGVLAKNGEHFCSIDTEVIHEKRHYSGRFMSKNKYDKRLAQHTASGACKKSHTVEVQCNHNIFDQSINNRHGCYERNPYKFDSQWVMRIQGYTWSEINEWAKMNGTVRSHTITKTIYTPNAPCKCDAWTFYNDCSYEIDWTHLDHGLAGWSRWTHDQRGNSYDEANLNRRAWRDELQEARRMDWRDELADE